YGRMIICVTVVGVLSTAKLTSVVTARRARWWSTLAKPRSSTGECRRRASPSSGESLPLRTSSKILRMASAFNGAPYEYYSVGRLQCGDATRLVLISEIAHKLRYFSRRLRRELDERLG